MRSIISLSVLALLLAAPVAARADNDDDDRTLLEQAQRSGKVMPLAQILEKLKPVIDGPIAGIEFDLEHGAAIYEIYWVDSAGRRREIHVDGRTASIIDTEKED